MMNNPKVYLAGKMDGGSLYEQGKGLNRDWRYPLVGDHLFVRQLAPGFYQLDEFDYLGPFYQLYHIPSEYMDKGTHAVGMDAIAKNDVVVNQDLTLMCCKSGIENADIIFVWLNTTEAHGTIAEMAYACGIKKGKNVTVVVPQCDCDTDDWSGHRSILHDCVARELWFVQALVRDLGGTVIYSDDPVEEFHKVIARWNRTNQKFNSVPEKEFWTRAINDTAKGLLYRDIVPQHPVGKYRLDFAIPELKFGIEIDGLAYHNGQDSFMKDRSRQREIESQGWRIVRFAAKEVSLDVDKCFREAETIALELSQSLVGAK